MVYGREREDLNNDLDNADRDVREREEESSNGALIALLCHHSQLDRVTVSLFVLHFDRDIRQIPTTNLIMRRARLSTLNCALVAQSSFSLLLCLVLLHLQWTLQWSVWSNIQQQEPKQMAWDMLSAASTPHFNKSQFSFFGEGTKFKNLKKIHKLTSWQDYNRTGWQGVKMTRWQNDMMTRWPDDQMTRWWHGPTSIYGAYILPPVSSWLRFHSFPVPLVQRVWHNWHTVYSTLVWPPS